MIHCLGDSHASVFTGTDTLIAYPFPNVNEAMLPYFTAYKLTGYATTAYNLYDKKPIIDSIVEKHIDKKNDYLMFCFGETDCRSHIVKHGKGDIPHTVGVAVKRYFDCISLYAKKGYRIIVFGPIAPSYITKDGDDYYKTAGSYEERLLATRVFNSLVEGYCLSKSYIFFTIVNEMLDEDGKTKLSMLKDEIHLNQTAMPIILEKLKRIEVL